MAPLAAPRAKVQVELEALPSPSDTHPRESPPHVSLHLDSRRLPLTTPYGLTLSTNRVHGFAFRLTSDRPIVLTALELQLDRSPLADGPSDAHTRPLRVFCTRTDRLPLCDWRQWALVGSRAAEPMGHALLTVRFDAPVPLGAHAARTLYVHSPTALPAWSPLRRAFSARREEGVRAHALGSHASAALWFEGEAALGAPYSMPRLVHLVYAHVDDASSATLEFERREPSLEQLLDYADIGVCNRMLIREWGAVPRRSLTWPPRAAHVLPPIEMLPMPAGACTESGVPPQGEGGGVVAFDAELGGMLRHPACEEMWRRYLSRFPGVEWLHDLGDIVQSASSCTVQTQRYELLRWALEMPAAPSFTVMACRHHSAVRTARRLLHAALAPSLDEDERTHTLQSLAALRCHTLRPHVRGFRKSYEYLAAARLHAARPREVGMGSFSLIRRLGRGGSATVYAARKEDTMALYALKVMDPRVHKFKLKHVLMERYISEKVVASPFLCGLAYAFHAGPLLVLTLPLYAGGTLQVQLEERARPWGGLPVKEVRWVAGQMILALQTLHRMRFIHRDVKPHNILLRSDGYYALGDFGLAARLDGLTSPEEVADESEPHGPVCNRAGTRGYWAPEVIRQEPQLEAADWWSLGVVLAHASTGVHPFKPLHAAHHACDQEDELEEELNANTLHAPITFPSHLEAATDSCRIDMLAMMRGLLTRSAEARLGARGAEELRAHAFIAGCIDLELLGQGRLRAPWTPNAALVYAKDHVDSHSIDATSAPLKAVPRWEYCCSNALFALELRELARKCPAELILSADEVRIDGDARCLEVDAERTQSRWAPALGVIAKRRKAHICIREHLCSMLLLLVLFGVFASAGRMFTKPITDDSCNKVSSAGCLLYECFKASCESCQRFRHRAAELHQPCQCIALHLRRARINCCANVFFLHNTTTNSVLRGYDSNEGRTEL